VRPVRALVVVIAWWAAALPVSAGGGAWLDAPPAGWNRPGAVVPHAPPMDRDADPRCGEQARPPAGAEDRAVAAAGWILVGALQVFGGTSVIWGAAGFDGMCRWWSYQVFVFADGRFAGTLSPEPMNSRTDGAATQVRLYSASHVAAEFARYTEKDPLCCPSRTSSVNFQIKRDAEGAAVVPSRAATSPSR